MRGSRNFCQFHLVLSLFYSLKRGCNGFIAEKTIQILYTGSRGGPLFSGWGCPTFSRGGGGGGGGPNANFYRKNSEYDQEIPQSQTADNPMAPRGRAAKPSRDTRKTN